MLLVLVGARIAVAAPDLVELVVAAPEEGGICPGEVHKLEVTAVDGRGKERRLKNGRGLTFEWELGEVDDHGTLTGPLDPRQAWGSAGLLTVKSEDSAVSAQVEIPLRFDCSITIAAHGKPGNPGEQGPTGAYGSPRAADGLPGQPGNPGGDAPEVHLHVVMADDPRTGKPVMQVDVEILGEEEHRYAAFDPEAGELVISVIGGRGGQGGRGGEGGDSDERGVGGNAGDGGAGGRGGRGGAVKVFTDASAAPHLKKIIVENAGGEGGPPGLAGRAGSGAGKDGADRGGRPGQRGVPGAQGQTGPAPEVLAAPVGPIW